MAAGQDQHDRFAGRERQRRTAQAVAAFADHWNRGPVQRRFDAAMASLPAQSAAAAADAARALFADDAWVEALIGGLARQLGTDPLFKPPFRAVNSDVYNGLLVFDDPRMSIAAGVSTVTALAAKKDGKRGPTSIGFTGRVSVLKFVKAGDALLSFWEAAPIGAGFSAATAGCCHRSGEKRLVDGDILLIDGRRQSYVIEHARSNLFFLHAEINLDQAPVSVEFDSASCAFFACSANGDGASRIQMLATLLRKLGRDDAFEALAPFLDHPDFFVRWHVMRELLGIDGEAALPHLKQMAARDPHPDVRRTARTALDQVTAPLGRKAA